MRILPIFKQNYAAICFASDQNFLPYTTVTIQSIVEHSNPSVNYDIIIFHSGVETSFEQKISAVSKGRENISVRLFDISNLFEDFHLFTKSVYTGTNYSSEIYYRLLIPSLMPDYPKVIYLDGDMLAVTDVAELYRIDLGEHMIGAVRDYAGICNCYVPGKDRRHYRTEILGLTSINDYFISSTLVFNVSKFNEKFSGEDLLRLAASREWRQHDQDVLNVVCQNSVKLIGAEWGVMEDYGENKFLPSLLWNEYQDSLKSPKLIHYAGPRKPWKRAETLYGDLFWKTAYHTEFFQDIFAQVTNLNYRLRIADMVTDLPTVREYHSGNCYVSNERFAIGNLADCAVRIERFGKRGKRFYLDATLYLSGVRSTDHMQAFLKIGAADYTGNVFLISTRNGENRYLFRWQFDFPPLERQTMRIAFRLDTDGEVICTRYHYGLYSPVSSTTPNEYLYSAGYAFWIDDNSLQFERCGRFGKIKRELRYLKSLVFSKKFSWMRGAVVRTVIQLWRGINKKNIWLISDRDNSAGDNGEALFRFLQDRKPRGKTICFVVQKTGRDFNRLKEFGKVVPCGSALHKLYYMCAECTISAHVERGARVSFHPFLRDVTSQIPFVFLQHGIIKDDLSDVYSRSRMFIDRFVTSAKQERESIVTNPAYAYLDSEVILTGLPRYDLLQDRREKMILVMPTWRKYCFDYDSRVDPCWIRKEGARESEYVRFYSALLTDERLLNALREYGYTLLFADHDLMNELAPDAAQSDSVRFVRGENKNYSELFSKGALLLTDYSSTMFDFVYLRKPVLYTQFDRDLFFESHTYRKGYFDYEKDGFGEVCYDLKSTVDAIIGYLREDCKLKEKYRERIDAFFAFDDRNNCERVYNEILKMLQA